MKVDLCPGEYHFRRSFIRLKQTDRTCWTIQTHSDELNWARRGTFHKLNSLCHSAKNNHTRTSSLQSHSLPCTVWWRENVERQNAVGLISKTTMTSVDLRDKEITDLPRRSSQFKSMQLIPLREKKNVKKKACLPEFKTYPRCQRLFLRGFLFRLSCLK